MRTTYSIANFFVDGNGVEHPIRYKAEDLVNKHAPRGYHWEQDLREYRRQCADVEEENRHRGRMKRPETKDLLEMQVFRYLSIRLHPPALPNPMYYIAVRNREDDHQT